MRDNFYFLSRLDKRLYNSPRLFKKNVCEDVLKVRVTSVEYEMTCHDIYFLQNIFYSCNLRLLLICKFTYKILKRGVTLNLAVLNNNFVFVA